MTVRKVHVSGRFEFAQDCAGRGSSHIAHAGKILLVNVNFDRHRDWLGGRSATAQAQQNSNEALDVISDHKVVTCPHGQLDMADSNKAKKPPSRWILRYDFLDRRQGQVYHFRLSRGTEAEPPRLPRQCGRKLSQVPGLTM